jgi:preprotein translocase subunit SecY
VASGGMTNIGKVAELRKRIFFTVLMLGLYRVGVFIAVPGVSREAFQQNFDDSGLLGLFSMFSGGALEQLSVFALGVMPYISASIIIQLLTVVVPSLERLKKEGNAGQQKITQYTRYGTILLAVVQGFGLAVFMESATGSGGTVQSPLFSEWGFRLQCVLTLTTGAVVLMWMGEQITERGIGNGISLLIFAGIVAQLPQALFQTVSLSEFGGGSTLKTPTLIIIGVVVIGVIGVIVFFERGQRRIPVRYAKKVVGQRMYGGQNTYLPLKVNTAGVIPPIFASSLLLFPGMLAGLFPNSGMSDWLQQNLIPGNTFYNVVFIVLIIFFCFFYTAVVFNPVDVADNMKKYGGFIPGIRAGKKTAQYIDRVLSRITLGGALYMSAVCVLPTFLQREFSVPFYFGGTALLIVVAVALDTVQQIESHLITHNYEGFGGQGSPKVRGRRRG